MILLSALSVVVAAFCVWLAVRIVNRREQWAKWTAFGLFAVLVVYPLSAGPACWLQQHQFISLQAFALLYWPLWCLQELSGTAMTAMNWYIRMWVDTGPPPAPMPTP
jgi:hypothetical protein